MNLQVVLIHNKSASWNEIRLLFYFIMLILNAGFAKGLLVWIVLSSCGLIT